MEQFVYQSKQYQKDKKFQMKFINVLYEKLGS